MAIYRLQINTVTRSAGRNAIGAAAYRAGERIRDERTGALYDHSKRADVLHKEIFLPSALESAGGTEAAWARDRAKLWNTAENAERRSDSRVAREYQVALPRELSAEQRLSLARSFSREIADRYNVAVDLAIHAPRPEGDPRNFHAHLLATTREVTAHGLGPKTGIDRDSRGRSELGLPAPREEFTHLRARWAELANDALREAGVEARVDHRSLEAQGVDREPRAQLPWAAIMAERKGERNEIAERIRERHREQHRQRVAARQEGAAQRDPTTNREVSAEKPADQPLDMDARRRQAVQDWLKYRANLEPARRGNDHETARPLSMDEIRQRAVAAWRSLRARGAESQSSAASSRERDGARERGDAEHPRDTPGLGDDLSG